MTVAVTPQTYPAWARSIIEAALADAIRRLRRAVPVIRDRGSHVPQRNTTREDESNG
jgi:hypothetical protein